MRINSDLSASENGALLFTGVHRFFCVNVRGRKRIRFFESMEVYASYSFSFSALDSNSS